MLSIHSIKESRYNTTSFINSIRGVQLCSFNRPEESKAEMDKMRSQNKNLQERVSSLSKKLKHCENEVQSLRQSKKQVIKEFKMLLYVINFGFNLQIAEREREKYSSELTALRRHQDSQITELEDQIRQLRERSLKILEEKDVEINKLRNALKNMSPSSGNHSLNKIAIYKKKSFSIGWRVRPSLRNGIIC
jgi:vacuolar-type H+-ATPase subunit I/STV1